MSASTVPPLLLRRQGGAGVAAAALLAYACLVLLRAPEIVLKGRFWAEEGTVFFVNAWTLHPLQALLMPVGGYLNLVANGATLAARWLVPLERAPDVTIAVALLFQLAPPLVLLLARDRWLQDWRVRTGGLLLLLLVPGSDEVWLQSLHCQFELAICCGLILALEVPQGGRAVFALALLVLAPLCGPGSIALVPLFLLRAAVDRSPGRLVQATALVAGSAVQIAFFFSLSSGRGYTLDPAVLLSVVTVKDLAVPFLGLNRAGRIALAIKAQLAEGQIPYLAVAAPVLVFGATAAAALRTRNHAAFWFLAGAAAAALSAYIGALDGTALLIHERAGGRYALVPLSLTALCFLALAAAPRSRAPRLQATWGWLTVCVWLLYVGARTYSPVWLPVRNGPAWPEQVAHWRADHAYVLQSWPSPWVVHLTLE